MKRFVLHIGMGKCGSTAIQSSLSSIDEPSVEYITYPGEIDANVLIAPYVRLPHLIPESIVSAIRRNPLDGSFVEYLLDRILKSDADCIIVSAEHISWLVGDEGSKDFVQDFLQPVSLERSVTVISYFRKPPASRFLSTLQEDAKYNSMIKLYVPDWPYSENHVVHERWRRLCHRNGFDWVPVVFSRDLLLGQNVLSDFKTRVNLPINLPFPSSSNIALDPILLCAYRNLVGPCLDMLDWDRKAMLLKSIVMAWKALAPELAAEPASSWKFRPEIHDYINEVSQHEDGDEYVNLMQPPPQQESICKVSWDPSKIRRILPSGLEYTKGFLTGPLHLFLDHVRIQEIGELEILLRTEVLRFFSTYYDTV